MLFRSHLRYMQLTFLQKLITYCRKENTEKSKYTLLNLPSNTAERISFLSSEKILPLRSSDVTKLIDCYNYFLWSYNSSQENLVINNASETRFDITEVFDRTNYINLLFNA